MQKNKIILNRKDIFFFIDVFRINLFYTRK